MRVIIVGAGILGAALAHKLADFGARVWIMDASGPASGATGASFGWLNASYFLNEAHFRLRVEGLAAWKRMGLGHHLTWQGSLCWDDDMDTQRDRLASLGYAVEDLKAHQIKALEPNLQTPSRALRFESEGIAAPRETVEALLQAAKGVKVFGGVRVTGLTVDAGRVSGVETNAGAFEADAVVLAAGTATNRLLAPLGVALPMLDRPGLTLSTDPMPPLIHHVIASDGQEVRQDEAGRLWAPMSVHHQSDQSETLTDRVDVLAESAMARVQALLPNAALSWRRAHLAWRPMPGDELPIIGATGPEGLYVSVMHSGMTLAAITAELLGKMVIAKPLSNAEADLVSPFAPGRFDT